MPMTAFSHVIFLIVILLWPLAYILVTERFPMILCPFPSKITLSAQILIAIPEGQSKSASRAILLMIVSPQFGFA